MLLCLIALFFSLKFIQQGFLSHFLHNSTTELVNYSIDKVNTFGFRTVYATINGKQQTKLTRRFDAYTHGQIKLLVPSISQADDPGGTDTETGSDQSD